MLKAESINQCPAGQFEQRAAHWPVPFLAGSLQAREQLAVRQGLTRWFLTLLS